MGASRVVVGMLWLGSVSLVGCGAGGREGRGDADRDPAGQSAERFSSAIATLLEFELKGELWVPGAPSAAEAKAAMERQLLYTIGQLNGVRSVGRLGGLRAAELETAEEGQGTRVRYAAVLPVAWGGKAELPTSYELLLPRRVSPTDLSAFTQKYGDTCVDPGTHELSSGSFWYYYRPLASACQLADEDIVRLTATVRVSAANTEGSFPEYPMVWSDGALKVIAIFGKEQEGATSDDDAGIGAFNTMIRALRLEYPEATTVPVELPPELGIAAPDVTFSLALADGRRLEVVTLLVDSPRVTTPEFEARYAALSGEADLIAYNGHAGLGANVRALARKGRWAAGKYLLFFMNGCDTFAYVDGALAEARAVVNPDDPSGTRYMELITNVMPSYFSSNAAGSMTLIRGLLAVDAPVSYEELLETIDAAQVVVVDGEEDNVYSPVTETHLSEAGTVSPGEERLFSVGLGAGAFGVQLVGTEDADLYVRAGAPPTQETYDCRPYVSGSRERCSVRLAEPSVLHVLVRGYSGQARFSLTVQSRR